MLARRLDPRAGDHGFIVQSYARFLVGFASSLSTSLRGHGGRIKLGIFDQNGNMSFLCKPAHSGNEQDDGC